MKKRSRLRYLPPWLVAAGLAAAALVVPSGSAAAQTFAGATEVVVVEVPVQVVKDGEPVRGLTAADFEVFDGRKKVPVTGFEVLDLAASAPAGAAAEAQIPASARRHFLLLFDLTFSEPSALSKARDAAKDVVKTLHPTDLMAVATYSSMQGPQLVLGFTPDRQQITTAIDTLGLPKLFNRTPDPLRLVLTDALVAQNQGPDRGGVAAEGRAAVDAEIMDTLKTISIVSSRAEKSVQQQIVRGLTQHLSDLAHLMGEVDGRKYVVFLSEGLDSSLVTGSGSSGAGQNDLQATIEQAGSTEQITAPSGGSGSDDQFGDTRTQNAVEKMLEEFRRADCQIQAVDIGG